MVKQLAVSRSAFEIGKLPEGAYINAAVSALRSKSARLLRSADQALWHWLEVSQPARAAWRPVKIDGDVNITQQIERRPQRHRPGQPAPSFHLSYALERSRALSWPASILLSPARPRRRLNLGAVYTAC
ncbi:MAG: hypothetical protein R2844_18190 [Caldilineales bacterium]